MRKSIVTSALLLSCSTGYTNQPLVDIYSLASERLPNSTTNSFNLPEASLDASITFPGDNLCNAGACPVPPLSEYTATTIIIGTTDTNSLDR